MLNYTQQTKVMRFKVKTNPMKPPDINTQFLSSVGTGFRLAQRPDVPYGALNVVFQLDADGENGESYDIEIRVMSTFNNNEFQRPELEDLVDITKKSAKVISEILSGEFLKMGIVLEFKSSFPIELIRKELILELNEIYPKGRR